MADHVENKPETVETTDRGFFGYFAGKKEEPKPEAETLPTELEKATVSEPLPQSSPFVAAEPEPAAVAQPEPIVEDKPETVETTDRGFFGKKEEKKPEAETLSTEFEKVTVSEPLPQPEPAVVAQPEPVVVKSEPVVFEEEHKEEEKKGSLLEKFHRSDSSSSSSSDEEEVGEDGEKKKKKKGLKEKLKEKIPGGDKTEVKHEEDTSIPIEKVEEPIAHPTEEKKSFLGKIKDKLPGSSHKKAEETPVAVAPPSPPAVVPETHDGEAKEKKGIFDKIKEKIPGYHHKTDEEKAEKEKEAPSH